MRLPRVDLEHTHLGQRYETFGGVDGQPDVRLVVAGQCIRQCVDLGGQSKVGVSLVEAAVSVSDGAAHQRERPVGDVRQHGGSDRSVVLGERELGELGLREQPLLRVGHPHADDRGVRAEVACRGGRVRLRSIRPGRVSAARDLPRTTSRAGLSSRTPRNTG